MEKTSRKCERRPTKPHENGYRHELDAMNARFILNLSIDLYLETYHRPPLPLDSVPPHISPNRCTDQVMYSYHFFHSLFSGKTLSCILHILLAIFLPRACESGNVYRKSIIILFERDPASKTSDQIIFEHRVFGLEVTRVHGWKGTVYGHGKNG